MPEASDTDDFDAEHFDSEDFDVEDPDAIAAIVGMVASVEPSGAWLEEETKLIISNRFHCSL